VRDAGSDHARIVVLDVDRGRTRSVRRLGDGDGELAVGDRGALDERVASAECDAPAHDHLGVALELRFRHRPLRHPRGP
jgi:hypothetical protein